MHSLGWRAVPCCRPPSGSPKKSATRWVRAQFGGFLRFHVTPGDQVEKGDLLATNISLVGQRLNKIKAPRAGIVLGMSLIIGSIMMASGTVKGK